MPGAAATRFETWASGIVSGCGTRKVAKSGGVGRPGRRRLMAVDPELPEILACPACKTPVILVHDGKGLKCSKCHRVYPIKDDIPVMLIDEATVEE
jgi:uncharacterized protein YbaR (Trm112 family)